MRHLVMVVWLFAVFATAVGAQQWAMSTPLSGTQWQLVSIDGAPLVPDSMVTLLFGTENDTAGGNGGCNTYGSNYTVDETSISISDVFSTFIACEATLEQELAYFAALQAAERYTIRDGMLTIITTDGAELVFEPLITLAGNEWVLINIGNETASQNSRLTLVMNEDGTAVGNGGCNRFSTTYTLDQQTIAFDAVVSTRIACVDELLNAQEIAYFAALEGAHSFQLTDDGTLIIEYSDTDKTLEFTSQTVLAAVAMQAQDDSIRPYAEVSNGQLILTIESERPVEGVISQDFSSLVWNADGSQLAFLAYDENSNAHIGVADAASGTAVLLDTPPLVAGYNLSWTSDDLILFMAEDTTQDPLDVANDQTIPVNIMSISPFEGATAEIVGGVRTGVGCGGGSPFPSDWVYWDETDGFRSFFLTLAQTPSGILYSMDCTAHTLGLFDPATGETSVYEQRISRVVPSPDGRLAAGIEVGEVDATERAILVIDLETGEVTSYVTSDEPDQLAWSIDGTTLYYSTRTIIGNVLEGLDEAQRQMLNTAFGFEMENLPSYAVTIYSLDLATEQDSEITRWNGYAVARMVEVDGSLFYSVVPNMDGWIEAVVAGETTAEAPDLNHYFVPIVLELNLEGDEAMELGLASQFTPFVQR